MQPLDVGRTFSAMFAVFKKEWVAFVLLALVQIVPMLIILAVFFGSVIASGGFDNPDDISDELAQGIGIGFVILMIIWVIVLAAVTVGCYALADAVIKGRHMPVGDAFKAGFARMWPMIGMWLISVVPLYLVLLAILAVVGAVSGDGSGGGALAILAILLAIPAFIYVGVAVSIGAAAIVAENAGPVQGLKRGFELLRGRFWPIIGRYLLLVLLVFAVSLLAAIPILGLLVAIPLWLAQPGLAAAFAMAIYYDCRGRRNESVDASGLMALLGIGGGYSPQHQQTQPSYSQPQPGDWAPPAEESAGGRQNDPWMPQDPNLPPAGGSQPPAPPAPGPQGPPVPPPPGQSAPQPPAPPPPAPKSDPESPRTSWMPPTRRTDDDR